LSGPLPVIVGITPGNPAQPITELALAAHHGGLRAVIVREPDLTTQAAMDIASCLKPVYGPGLILHSRTPIGAELAIELGCGLHLPATADPARHRRAMKGWLGISCHTLSDLLAAAQAGCDYATLSPVFSPLSKPSDQRPCLGLNTLREICTQSTIPIVALGGITPQNLGACLTAGAASVASMGMLFPPNATPLQCRTAAMAMGAAHRSG